MVEAEQLIYSVVVVEHYFLEKEVEHQISALVQLRRPLEFSVVLVGEAGLDWQCWRLLFAAEEVQGHLSLRICLHPPKVAVL